MDRGDIIGLLAVGVVFFSTVIGMLFWRAGAETVEAPEAVAMQPAQPAALPPTLPPFTSATIEEIHRKYDALVETDPILAGKLKYAELLQHHGE